jgi:hybrid cluster-associated redox disulfide protein
MSIRITAHVTAKTLLDTYPQLVPWFMNLGLLCIGCPAQAFHTLEDIAKEYGYDCTELIQSLQGKIEGSK